MKPIPQPPVHEFSGLFVIRETKLIMIIKMFADNRNVRIELGKYLYHK